MDFGFEGAGNGQGSDNLQTTNADGQRVDENGNVIQDINDNQDNNNDGGGGNNNDDNHNDHNNTNDNNNDNNNNNNNGNNNNNNNNNNDNNNDSEIILEEGMTIEIPTDNGVVKYTVDKDKNLVGEDGKIFKEAKDVKEFLKDFSTGDDNDENDITLETIQNAIGIEVTDDKGNKLTYENTPEGIKSYINDVLDNQKKEAAEASVNALFTKYPVLENFLNYYIANGNSYKGFGESVDRTGITLDENNIAQQEDIIRTAWKEQNRAGDVDSYINWLKSSGTLYATAKTDLEGLQKLDKDNQDRLAKEAKEAEEARIKEVTEYWNDVHETIKSRKVAGYTIPESIILTKDGHKVANTPEDFFNYVYQVDQQGHSRYENDLLKLTPEQRRDDEILRAYLMFTGGSYADLVKMAINEDKIKTIRLQAKNNKNHSIRVTPKGNKNNQDVDLGY